MTFRDDRDALLAQAQALRVQLAEAQARLAEAQADDDAELRAEVERLREEVASLRGEDGEPLGDVIPVDARPLPPLEKPRLPEVPAPEPAPPPPPRVEPPIQLSPQREVVGSTIRGPAPDLPPPGNPWVALLALLGILAVAAGFAAIALSGS